MTTITKDTVIADLLKTDIAQEAVPVLQSIGMHCLGCIMATQETIGEACQAHNVNADDLVAKLVALTKQ